jgi:beta-mannanase
MKEVVLLLLLSSFKSNQVIALYKNIYEKTCRTCAASRQLSTLRYMYVYLASVERQGILVSYQWKNKMEVAT